MKTFRSLIERNLWYLLSLTLVVNVALGVLLYANTTQTNRNTAAIESNQYSNSVSLEAFWRNGLVCVFTAPKSVSTSGKPAIIAYVDNCFQNTPEVK